MLVTASTVKDTLPHLRQFVDRNLAGGVDHLLVFVDDFDPEVTAALDEHPHVTAVATGPDWWHGKRPRQLNFRQRINANVARVLLAGLPGAEWLFHIDADECLQVDRAALAELPDDRSTVRARPVEAVSRRRWPGDRVTHFKRLLSEEELTLLHVLGVVDQPTNGSYFHGHVDGKVGARPTMDRWLTLHGIEDVQQQAVSTLPWEHARLLHYESWSGEEFVRKWTSNLASGTRLGFRPSRAPVAVALRALGDRGLGEKQAQKYLRRIYERTTQDDFTTLRDLGLLEEIDPSAGEHRPESLGGERERRLRTMLAAVAPENKWPFHTGRTVHGLVRLLDRAADRVTETDPGLTEELREAWRVPADVLAAVDDAAQSVADEPDIDEYDPEEQAQGSA